MNVETPPPAGELDFKANKEAYERYFINVAGILAANNQFNGPFLDRLNETLEPFGLVLTETEIVLSYARSEAQNAKKQMYEEAERIFNSQRLKYITTARKMIRDVIAKKDEVINELKQQLEENSIKESVTAQRAENAAMSDLDSAENDYFFEHVSDKEFHSLMENEIPHGIFTPSPKKKQKTRKRKAGAAARKLDPEFGGSSSLKPTSLKF